MAVSKNQFAPIIHRSLLVAFLVSITFPAQAQYIEQWSPLDRYRYLPRLPEGNENPPPLSETAREATGSEEVLVDELKALVLVDSADRVRRWSR